MRHNRLAVALALLAASGCHCKNKTKVNSVQSILVAKPLKLDFGDVPVGTTSPPLSVTISNESAVAMSLVKNTPRIAAGGPAFALSGGSVTAVAPGASATIQVTFSPKAEGAAQGSLVIDSHAAQSGASFTIPLLGNGNPALTVSVNPVSIVFPETYRQTTASRTFTLTNTGTETAFLGQPTLTSNSSPDFAVSPLTSTTLGPGKSETDTLTFTPSQSEFASAKVDLNVSDARGDHSTPLHITLVGACQPRL